MSPYREADPGGATAAPSERGIVGDVIAQFADQLAFLRELVQNAIDAGSPTIEVRCEHDAAAGVARVSVRDRGEGMTRDIIEQQLLVLFRSTKERDPTKIGKFGIGFASVLAPSPRVVVVATARAGRRFTLHLFPDLTYELFDGGPATQTGTTVTLELVADVAQAVELAGRCEQALGRWCRHATVPIDYVAEVAGAGHRRAARIDRPLGIDGALVEARFTTDGGALTAVVGLLPASEVPTVAFFNHGLTLYETREPMFGRLAARLQDARLGHTLSRDDVRRDAQFVRAVEVARELVRTDLPAAVATALRHACEAGDLARYDELAAAAVASSLGLAAASSVVPLIEPLGEAHEAREPRAARACTAAALGAQAWTSPLSTPLTRALAAAGVRVVRATADTAALLRAITSCQLVAVEAALIAISAIAPTPAERVLLDTARALLDEVHRAPPQLVLARVAGGPPNALAVAAGPRDAVHEIVDPGDADAAAGSEAPAFVVPAELAGRAPFGRLRRPPLVLSVAHPVIAAARRATDPVTAGAQVARAVLVYYRALDADRSAALLESALARRLGGAP